METKMCVCGTILNKNDSGHYRKCDYRNKIRDDVLIGKRKEIVNDYKETYSVSLLLEKYNNGIGEGITHIITRRDLVKILREDNVYEGLSGENYLKKKVESHKINMMEKYGVENWGQTENGGYKEINKVPYEKISILSDDYKKYREQVAKITNKSIKNIEVPKYCEYTGIQFADEEGKTNPNDPRKRSVDHKIPTIICYLNGISVEEAGSRNNIIFVLKYVNSIKGNTLHESFLTISNKIRKVFINEGFKSN